MSFEEELREVIRKAQEENAQEERDASAFAAGWELLRTHQLWRILNEAKEVIKEERIGAHASLTNGSIVLEAKQSPQTGRFEHKLKFSPKHETREVVCSSSIPDSPEESFTLDALTEEAVQAKVKQFIYEILRGKKRKRSGLLVA